MQGPLSTDRAPHSDAAMGNITDGDFTVTIHVTNHSLWKDSQYYRMVFICTTETRNWNGFSLWECKNDCVNLCPINKVPQGLLEIIEVKKGIMNNISRHGSTLSPSEIYHDFYRDRQCWQYYGYDYTCYD